MLSPSVLSLLSQLTYCIKAERRVCILPLGGIFWEDEMPNLTQLMKLTAGERDQVYRLFALRYKIWDGLLLGDDERAFWDEARAELPNYALFRRSTISDEDYRAHKNTEEEEFERFLAEAEEVKLSETNGVHHFEAKFDLTETECGWDDRRPWWKRILRPRR